VRPQGDVKAQPLLDGNLLVEDGSWRKRIENGMVIMHPDCQSLKASLAFKGLSFGSRFHDVSNYETKYTTANKTEASGSEEPHWILLLSRRGLPYRDM
jgi:hypothetical protein